MITGSHAILRLPALWNRHGAWPRAFAWSMLGRVLWAHRLFLGCLLVSVLALTSDDQTRLVLDRPADADPSLAGDFRIDTGFTQLRLSHRYRGDKLSLETTGMVGWGSRSSAWAPRSGST